MEIRRWKVDEGQARKKIKYGATNERCGWRLLRMQMQMKLVVDEQNPKVTGDLTTDKAF